MISEHLEDIRDRCRPIPGRTPAENQAFLLAVAALELLDGCKRAWRDTPDGRVWYRLVPIPTPEEIE